MWQRADIKRAESWVFEEEQVWVVEQGEVDEVWAGEEGGEFAVV